MQFVILFILIIKYIYILYRILKKSLGNIDIILDKTK